VHLLVEKGANVNAKDKYGQTALMKAIIANGGPPHADVVRILIEKGADLNTKDVLGITALGYARGKGEIVRMLERAGAR